DPTTRRAMMLRKRNTNLPEAQKAHGAAKANVDPPAKRAASKQAPSKNEEDFQGIGEPKPKRAVLAELTTKLSNGLVLNSVRKGLGVRKSGNGQLPRQATKGYEKRAPLAEAEDVIVEEAKTFDPCPGYDYDAENKNDEFSVPDYAFEIHQYLRGREKDYAVGDYMKSQPKLSKEARAVLVDWMIEVQETFELNHETLYLSVKVLDTYFQNTKKKVRQEELQMLASAAIFVVSKYEERSPPLIDDFIYLSEDSYKRTDLEEAERDLFRTVAFDLGAPLSYSQLRRYAKASKSDMRALTLARYILETSLMIYEFVSASESKMAAGAFLLALRMIDEKAEWTPVMHKYSGYSAEEVEPWVWALNHMMHIRASGRGAYAQQHTVSDKYSHEIFFESTKVPLIADKFALKSPIVCPE
ncbi:hypothetical protein PMAYCL1PPCAC_32340, partial [Pristionchus mayeri]